MIATSSNCYRTVAGVVIGTCMACLFAGLWFAYPLARRGRNRRSQTE